MKPSVGRMVHYVSYGTPGGEYASQCRAAIVTEVVPETEDNLALAEVESWDEEAHSVVGLCVLNPTGLFFNQGVRWDPNKAGGTWHWPERET
jgi:hypothetical protein